MPLAERESPVYSLAHVESKTDIFIFGEEEDEEMITCLTLFNVWVETDLENERIKNNNNNKKKLQITTKQHFYKAAVKIYSAHDEEIL